MTRVIHLHFHPRRTGITRHVESVVAAMNRAAGEGVLVFGTSLAPGVPRCSPRELVRFLRRGPGIIHAHRNLEILFGLFLRAVGRQLRLVVTRHSATIPSAFTRFLLRRADLRIALTEEMASAMGASAEVVGHGIDLASFSPPSDRRAAFAALGLAGRYAIGVVGRVRHAKGQGDFAEAWQGLEATRRAEWTPVFVGAVRPADREFADALTRAVPNLVFTGELADVGPWLRGLSIIVQPSRSEGFSLVVLEAMASGACVVAARLPHFERGMIEHESTGFLYPPGDVAALRACLEKLISDPELTLEVGRRAAEHARRRFGIEVEVARLQRLYERLLEAPS